ncbi:hypothetical protein JHK85_055358 [Glycine max]|nr:hypothetical protein JHK85_055358 [Glycine max]
MRARQGKQARRWISERERERMVREVSESCVDSLLTEMVACYCNRFYANKPELAARRIEAIGYQVGHQLSERYTMERPRFTDHLEAIKFICKDFWSELFKKQIDNLKTNHRIAVSFPFEEVAYMAYSRVCRFYGGYDNIELLYCGKTRRIPIIVMLLLFFWTVSVNQMGSNQDWKHSVMVCAPITTQQSVSVEQIANDMYQAKAEDADIVEVRLDCITNFHPPKWEGGLYEGDENMQLEALQLAVELGADFIEVQLKVPLIAYSVGERGLISQLLSQKFGGFFVYESLAGNPIPGLPSLDNIQEAYKLEHVKADTKVFGLISKPISHSKGPILHNPPFRHINYNGIYVPMFVDDLKEFFNTYPCPDFSGFIVGIPYKEEILRFCDEVHPLAQSIGAVNTIIRRARHGKLVGYNTHCEAAITAIEDALIEHGCNDGGASLGSPLAGRLFVLVGAGGAGIALAFGSKSRGALLVIFDINFDRAKSLACAVFGEAQPFKELVNFQPEKEAILANATPVGMLPNTDRIPVAERLVFDAVYRLRRTRLLKEADAAGAITVGGVEMFLRQAIGQFNLFTGLEAPEEFMREIVLSKF